ncbi:hypothetical protein BC833DRAFT_652803 [Globomyces pollinis-pini]|nr:hypothetical protein BC833DRAFT_652803 [Globomyces pollinis-pini]
MNFEQYLFNTFKIKKPKIRASTGVFQGKDELQSGPLLLLNQAAQIGGPDVSDSSDQETCERLRLEVYLTTIFSCFGKTAALTTMKTLAEWLLTNHQTNETPSEPESSPADNYNEEDILTVNPKV